MRTAVGAGGLAGVAAGAGGEAAALEMDETHIDKTTSAKKARGVDFIARGFRVDR